MKKWINGCLKILKKEFAVKEDGIYRIGGPLDLTFLMKMYGLDGFDGQKDTEIYSAAGAGTDWKK